MKLEGIVIKAVTRGERTTFSIAGEKAGHVYLVPQPRVVNNDKYVRGTAQKRDTLNIEDDIFVYVQKLEIYNQRKRTSLPMLKLHTYHAKREERTD